MRKLGRLRQLSVAFRSSEDGSVAVQFGIASIALIGLVALAVDFTGANAKKAKLQSAADSAAVAGATVLVKEGTDAEAAAWAEEHLLSGTGRLSFSEVIDASAEAERVSVSLTSDHPSMAGNLFGGPMTVGVESIARLGPPSGNPVCLHALHGTMSKAVDSTWWNFDRSAGLRRVCKLQLGQLRHDDWRRHHHRRQGLFTRRCQFRNSNTRPGRLRRSRGSFREYVSIHSCRLHVYGFQPGGRHLLTKSGSLLRRTHADRRADS